jgi:hypothetical protein
MWRCPTLCRCGFASVLVLSESSAGKACWKGADTTPIPHAATLHLQIELNLSELRVVCELRPADSSLSGSAAASASEGLNDGNAAQPAVEALEQSLRLRGGERSWVTLPLRLRIGISP